MYNLINITDMELINNIISDADMTTGQTETGVSNKVDYPEITHPAVTTGISNGADSSSPTGSGAEGRRVVLIGDDVAVSQIGDHLFVPTDWMDEAVANPCLAKVQEFIQRLSPVALVSPWIITSMSKDLSGKDRTDSTSHAEGRAIDVSPMFDEDTILPSTMPMMGLAWNVKSLILISEAQWGDMPMFVEGDHIHFGASIKPDDQGCLPIMWSDSDAYPSQAAQADDPILSRLRRSFWRWSTPTLTLQPPSGQLQTKMRDLLMSEH